MNWCLCALLLALTLDAGAVTTNKLSQTGPLTNTTAMTDQVIVQKNNGSSFTTARQTVGQFGSNLIPLLSLVRTSDQTTALAALSNSIWTGQTNLTSATSNTLHSLWLTGSNVLAGLSAQGLTNVVIVETNGAGGASIANRTATLRIQTNAPGVGGSGDVTTAQLNTYSNALVTLSRSQDTTTSNALVTLANTIGAAGTNHAAAILQSATNYANAVAATKQAGSQLLSNAVASGRINTNGWNAGSNVTLTTNASGEVTITATLTGGTATLGDITNIFAALSGNSSGASNFLSSLLNTNVAAKAARGMTVLEMRTTNAVSFGYAVGLSTNLFTNSLFGADFAAIASGINVATNGNILSFSVTNGAMSVRIEGSSWLGSFAPGEYLIRRTVGKRLRVTFSNAVDFVSTRVQANSNSGTNYATLYSYDAATNLLTISTASSPASGASDNNAPRMFALAGGIKFVEMDAFNTGGAIDYAVGSILWGNGHTTNVTTFSSGSISSGAIKATNSIAILNGTTNSTPSIVVTRNATTGVLEDSALTSIGLLHAFDSSQFTLTLGTNVSIKPNATFTTPDIQGGMNIVGNVNVSGTSRFLMSNGDGSWSLSTLFDSYGLLNIFGSGFRIQGFSALSVDTPTFDVSGAMSVDTSTFTNAVYLLNGTTNTAPYNMQTRNPTTGRFEDAAVPVGEVTTAQLNVAVTNGVAVAAGTGGGTVTSATSGGRQVFTVNFPAGGGVQTPWAQDINGAGFKLTNAGSLQGSNLTVSSFSITNLPGTGPFIALDSNGNAFRTNAPAGGGSFDGHITNGVVWQRLSFATNGVTYSGTNIFIDLSTNSFVFIDLTNNAAIHTTNRSSSAGAPQVEVYIRSGSTNRTFLADSAWQWSGESARALVSNRTERIILLLTGTNESDVIATSPTALQNKQYYAAAIGQWTNSSTPTTVPGLAFTNVALQHLALGRADLFNLSSGTYRIPFTGTYKTSAKLRYTDNIANMSYFANSGSSNGDHPSGFWGPTDSTAPAGEKRNGRETIRVNQWVQGDLIRLVTYAGLAGTKDIIGAELSVEYIGE